MRPSVALCPELIWTTFKVGTPRRPRSLARRTTDGLGTIGAYNAVEGLLEAPAQCLEVVVQSHKSLPSLPHLPPFFRWHLQERKHGVRHRVDIFGWCSNSC